MTHRLDAIRLEAEQARRGNGACDRDERCRYPRDVALNQDQNGHRDTANGDGHHRGLRQRLDDAGEIVEERTLVEVNAEQLWHLVEHDDEPDTGLESRQHWFRDEIRDEPEPQHRSGNEDCANNRGQRHAGGDEGRGISGRRHLSQCRG
jgi:hypothetical protein